MDCNEIDVQKLHAESLQLRNQQFQLGTIALAGSGLSAWIAPGLTAVTQGDVPEVALLTGSISWLGLLFLLYYWSQSLRRMITIISKYMVIKGLSLWESEFHAYHKRRDGGYFSQTLLVTWAFTAYGTIAVFGSVFASIAVPDKIQLSGSGFVFLMVCFGVYLSSIWTVHKVSYRREKRIEPAWRDSLGIR